MKSALLVLFLVSLLGGGLNTITRLNQYAREAATAYTQEDYTTAITAYEYLLNDLEVQDDQLRLNLAHSYYKANLLQKAQEQYYLLADHPSNRIHAVVMLQLGNLAAAQKKYNKALGFFRSALISEPGNDAARYNYELLKKYLLLHPELEKLEEEAAQQEPATEANPDLPPPAAEEQAQQNGVKPDESGTEEKEMDSKEQEEAADGTVKGPASLQQGTPDNNGSEQQGNQEREQAAGNEAGDTKGQLNNSNNPDLTQRQRIDTNEQLNEQDVRARTQRSRLQQMNISPEKAQLLLDAMRHAEQQYIQQLPRKSTKKQDTSKPDW